MPHTRGDAPAAPSNDAGSNRPRRYATRGVTEARRAISEGEGPPPTGLFVTVLVGCLSGPSSAVLAGIVVEDAVAER